MRERRAGRDHLGARDIDSCVGLAGDMSIDVGWAAGRPRRHVAVDRRMHDCMIDIWHPLLAVAVPAPCVLLIGGIKLGIRSESREKGCLVVGRASEPAIGNARPSRDRVAPCDELLG